MDAGAGLTWAGDGCVMRSWGWARGGVGAGKMLWVGDRARSKGVLAWVLGLAPFFSFFSLRSGSRAPSGMSSFFTSASSNINNTRMKEGATLLERSRESRMNSAGVREGWRICFECGRHLFGEKWAARCTPVLRLDHLWDHLVRPELEQLDGLLCEACLTHVIAAAANAVPRHHCVLSCGCATERLRQTARLAVKE